MLEFLKVIVQTVVLERDEDGSIVGERLSEPTPLYSPDDIVRFVEEIKRQIVIANDPILAEGVSSSDGSNGSDGVEDQLRQPEVPRPNRQARRTR